MNKGKKIALIGLMMFGLSGCELLSTSADIASDTILVSMKIDSMQTELGQYATSQDALDDLDDLQVDVFNTLTSGEGIEDIYSYQARGKVIYSTLTAEITERWDELTVEQQEVLIAIDNELIELNTSIDSLLASTGISDDLIEIMSQAVTLMSYYSVLL